MSNLFVRLKQILPPAPVLVGLVTEHHAEDDTSTVVLPTNEGRIEYAAGVAVGSTIRARGTTVAIGDKAFVRNGVIETRAPSEDAIEIEIGRVVPPAVPLVFSGPIDDQGGVEGAAFTPVDVSAEWSGGSGALTFSVATGTLPAGVALSSAGVLSGTPTTEALTTGLKLRATDTAGYRADSNEFSFDVTAAPTAARWVSVAAGFIVYYSDDGGATWVNTGHAFPASANLCWGNGVFVAALTNVAANNIYTSPDGITWTQRTTATASARSGIAWNGSIFVVGNTASGSNRVETSPDGVTWTARSVPVDTASGQPFIYLAGDLFVLTMRTTTDRCATSPDGINWTARATPLAGGGHVRAALKIGSTYSLLNESDVPNFVTTTDFVSFTARTNAVNFLVGSINHGVANNGTVWVCVGVLGIFSTTDGLTFTKRNAGFFSRVHWTGGEFVVRSGTTVLTSPDGVTWSSISASPSFVGSGSAVAFEQLP